MRPIKFRAFHKELKVMREVLKINIAHDEVTVYLENDDSEICECETWFEGTFELMQFTGLHDRNGKPIFENDILWMKGGDYMRVVKWSEEDASFSFNKTGLTFCKSNEKWMELIGNLMENPELLESNK